MPILERFKPSSSLCRFRSTIDYDAQIRQGHTIDKARTRILHIKSEVMDTIGHDTLPILKYPCIIDYRCKKLDVIKQCAQGSFVFNAWDMKIGFTCVKSACANFTYVKFSHWKHLPCLFGSTIFTSK